MKPTVGRIVHYTYENDDKKVGSVAAIVTRTKESLKELPGFEGSTLPDDTTVDLEVFDVIQSYRLHCVGFSENPKEGYWTWPPKV